MSKTTAPYGTWLSPIDSDTVISDNIVFDDVVVDPITYAIYHLEERPEDRGRCVIVNTRTNDDVLLPPYSARDSVHDYGGAPAIVYDGIVYFSNDSGCTSNPDNSIYAINLNENPGVAKRITPVNGLWRYANFAIHPKKTDLLVTIREDHTNDPDGTSPDKVVNTLCVLNTKNATVNVLIQGADFYATPVFNPSGTKIAWQEWYLPDMPWQGGIVFVANVDTSSGTIVISNPIRVAGEKVNVSATFPTWVDDTTLLYTSDGENHFQNPFTFDTATQQSKFVIQKDQDFAEPAWWLGLYPYAILDGGIGVFTAFENGKNVLYITDLVGSSQPTRIEDFGYAVAQHLRHAGGNTFVFTGIGSSSPGGVILGTVSGSSGSYSATFDVLKNSVDPTWFEKYKAYISTPDPNVTELITPEPDSHTIYVVYYGPQNPDYSGPSTEKPPCIIGVHGGPTGLEAQGLSWTKNFYTSRGFAWLDVNYRGSSGYGRDYMELLGAKWGRFDVADCKDSATILSGTPYSLIDPKRVAIRGGSAGGYTTLSSLTFAPDPGYYKAACSAFGGVADPTYLTKVIEKFESQYMYWLFGCKPDGGNWDPWNPIKHVEGNFSVPLLMLHGTADGVVPIQVAEDFLAEIQKYAPSVPVDHKFYEGEGHHFHQAKNIKDALDREHKWYVDHLL